MLSREPNNDQLKIKYYQSVDWLKALFMRKIND